MGSESMGSECKLRFQTQFVYDAEPIAIGFGTLLYIWNPFIPNPVIRNLMIRNLIVQNKHIITNILYDEVEHIHICIWSEFASYNNRI